MRMPLLAVALASMALSTFASAGVTTVTTTTGSASKTKWGTVAGENSGGGSTKVTNAAPRSGNGSLELRGDRSRAQLGNQFGGFFTSPTNLLSLSTVTGLSFDWRIAADSSGAYNVDQTPALRLLVQDGSTRSELVWEGVYNGTYGNTARDTWYSTTFGASFYQYKNGGVTLAGGSQVNKTIASWIAGNYSSAAYVSAISVGVGSGFSKNYHAFADNVTLGTLNGSTTYNFETQPVPEPSTWAATFAGFAAFAAAKRRKRARA